ncbi:hypothetical protein D9M68_916910 [compost metagenome]
MNDMPDGHPIRLALGVKIQNIGKMQRLICSRFHLVTRVKLVHARQPGRMLRACRKEEGK